MEPAGHDIALGPYVAELALMWIGAHLEWRILRRIPARAASGTHGSLGSRPGHGLGFLCESNPAGDIAGVPARSLAEHNVLDVCEYTDVSLNKS